MLNLTFTPQTYHHPVHRFRTWPMQTTSQSHSHKQVQVQPKIHITIPTQSFCLDKTKQPLTKSRQNNLHSVHTRPCRIYEQSGPNNKQQSTTHGNALKGSGSYLRPKTHIQHTHPHHLSTSTQTSTQHKLQQDEVNRRRHSWLPIKQLCDRLWSMPLLYGRLLHPRPALTNCKSCRTQH